METQHRVILRGVIHSESMSIDSIQQLAKSTGTTPFLCYDNGYSHLGYDPVGWDTLRDQDYKRNVYLWPSIERYSETSFS